MRRRGPSAKRQGHTGSAERFGFKYLPRDPSSFTPSLLNGPHKGKLPVSECAQKGTRSRRSTQASTSCWEATRRPTGSPWPRLARARNAHTRSVTEERAAVLCEGRGCAPEVRGVPGQSKAVARSVPLSLYAYRRSTGARHHLALARWTTAGSVPGEQHRCLLTGPT